MQRIDRQLRQGDVLLHPVAALPAGAIPVKGRGPIVLAEGEVTGHSHRVVAPRAKVRPYTDGAQLYLEVSAPVQVVHQEHAALALEPGVYLVKRQTEVWMDEVRQVAD